MKTIINTNQISRIKMYPETPVKNVKLFPEAKPNWRNLWTERRDAGFYYIGGFSKDYPFMEFDYNKKIHVIIDGVMHLKPRVEIYMSCGGRETRYFETYEKCAKHVTWLTRMSDDMFAVVEVNQKP